MATKPLLPEVVAERAKAADEYRKAHQAAIDRIEKLRAARMKRDAALQTAQAGSAPDKKASPKRSSDKRASAASDKRSSAKRAKGAGANANPGA